MKKLLITLVMATIATTTVLSLEFVDAAAAGAHFEEIAKWLKEKSEGIQKALVENDDEALKKEIFELGYMVGDDAGIEIETLKKIVEDLKIPYDRVLKILKKTIHEYLSALSDKDVSKRGLFLNKIFVAIRVLEAIPGTETLAFLEECLQSQDHNIRIVAMRSYNAITGETREPTSEPVIPPSITRTDTLQSEPPPPVVLDEMKQTNQGTLSEQPVKSSPNKNILMLIVIVLLAVIGGLVIWRKNKK